MKKEQSLNIVNSDKNERWEKNLKKIWEKTQF